VLSPRTVAVPRRFAAVLLASDALTASFESRCRYDGHEIPTER